MREVDLMVHGADWLITLDEKRQIYRDGALAVQADTIVEVGKTDALLSKYRARRNL